MAPPFVAHAILGGFTKPRESRISETNSAVAHSLDVEVTTDFIGSANVAASPHERTKAARCREV